jgi:predicted naringenin-chalcone synthase
VDEDWENHRIYSHTKETPNGTTIDKRNLYFSEKAKTVFSKIYADSSPKSLVHVTCTGYVSPSPAQQYFESKSSRVDITHAYHMGCYASIPAIRIAAGLTLLNNQEVDVVHTEMCSLHLDSSLHTPEQMVVQTLFADGHIKYSLSKEKKGLKLLNIREELVKDSKEDMTWVPGPNVMQMTLSKEVPIKIRDSLPSFVNGLTNGLDFSKAIFAIHPGGPKIIEAVQKKLELSDEQVKYSQEVLFERGNMSSATLPHVWEKILKDKSNQGKIVISLAFGPGLTIFGSVFEVCS